MKGGRIALVVVVRAATMMSSEFGTAPRDVAATLLALSLAFNHATQERASPTFRSGVEAVLLDVSVLDANRRPVRGLTAADFSVTEDGMAQTISSFSSVEAEEYGALTRRPVWLDWSQTDVVATNRIPPHGRLVVLVLDDLLPMAPGDSPRARDLAAKIVDAVGPSDLVGVAFASGRQPAVNLTLDRATLKAAVGRYNPRWSRDFENAQGRDAIYRAATGSIRRLVEAVGSVSGRRKALVWITAGMPIAFHKADDRASTGSSQALRDEWKEIFDVAAQGNVSIYPVDPGGLRGAAIRLDQLDLRGGIQNEGEANVQFLESIAVNTGGLAVVRNNDPGPGLGRVLDEVGSYYLIGYQPSRTLDRPSRHRIHVRVNDPRLTVRSRKEYWSAPRDFRKSALTAARQSVAPVGDIALTASAAPFREGDGSRGTLAVVVAVVQPLAPRQTATRDTLDFMVDAYGTNGRSSGSVSADVTLSVPAGRGEVSYELLTPLTLRPGHHELRVVVASRVDGKLGGLTLDVEVPDFAKEALSLSGLVFATEPSGVAVPRQALKALLSVVPTAHRVFSKMNRVTGLVQVYQGAGGPIRPVRLRSAIQEDTGHLVLEQSETLDPTRFASGRVSECQFVLPTERLSSGEYLWTVDAVVADNVVRRSARFGVR